MTYLGIDGSDHGPVEFGPAAGMHCTQRAANYAQKPLTDQYLAKSGAEEG
jgi:hypothetical protein